MADLADGCALTLLLVDSEDNHHLVLADTDELLDRTDTTSGQFTEQDHALNVVVLEQLHVSTHLGNLTHVHHDEIIDLGELARIHATGQSSRHVENMDGLSGERNQS